MPWRSDPEVRQWIMILVGLAMGGLARWALLIRDKEMVTWKIVATDLMVMGVLGLAAKWTVGRLGIEGETTALIAALFALSSDRIVRLMLAWFLNNAKRAAREPDFEPTAPEPRPPKLRDPVTGPDAAMDGLIDELDRKTGGDA